MATFEIDDAETAMTKTWARTPVVTFAIRPSMREQACDGAQSIAIDGAFSLLVPDSGNATQ
jgi:hypothetical protein